MRYTEFKIVEGYKEVTQKFAQEADLEQVKSVIAQYRDLVDRNQVQGNERNIDWWGKQRWERFSKFVSAKSQQQSQTQQKRRKNVGRSHNLAENDEWLIVIPLDKDASCFHGKGSDWCTTKPDHDYFEQYFRDGHVTLIYFLQKQTGRKWAIAVHDSGMDEYFDINDNSIGNGDFADQTGIPLDTVMKYVDMVYDKTTDVSKKVDVSRNKMKDELERVADMIDDLRRSGSKERSPAIETLLLKTHSGNQLKKYMYAVANDEDNPTEFDQNMQSLIAVKIPHMLSNIANLTEKTIKLAVQNDNVLIGDIEKAHPELVYNTIKNNPKSIPEPTTYIDKISPELQKLFIEHNPLWIIAFEDKLDSRLAQQKDKVLTQYFDKNPKVYAIITEPGLTDLSFYQLLTQEEYKKAVDLYGTDSFEATTREKK